jgi:hypothetical protein
MTLISQIPAGLLAAVLVATALLVFLSGLLGWHWIRRVLDVPRVPRPRGMYWALAVTWSLLAIAVSATAMAVLLLRDHHRVDGRTQIGELRCEPALNGHVRAEIRTPRISSTATPEGYDLEGDTCVVAVKEIDLRPGLKVLGLGAMARLDAVGKLARPTTNPRWLTPAAMSRPSLLGLVVQHTRAVPLVIRADAKQRFVVFAAPGQAPELQPLGI